MQGWRHPLASSRPSHQHRSHTKDIAMGRGTGLEVQALAGLQQDTAQAPSSV